MRTSISKSEIEPRIFTIRGVQVMLDRDLAMLLATSTKRINEVVKRNTKRFPTNFLIQLNELEKKEVVANCDHLKSLKYSSKLPFCFTEHGVAMLATLLKSELAVEISIHIINVFIDSRKQKLISENLYFQINFLQNEIQETNKKVEHIFSLLKNPETKKHGIFFNDQIFDAYVFACNLIQKAKHSIILIDNYIDETTLLQLSKRNEGVSVTIFTQKITTQLQLDLTKHNAQYPSVIIKTIKHVHDRFLIIDDKELYHIGASLKDLGKKWFAFSRIDSLIPEVKKKL